MGLRNEELQQDDFYPRPPRGGRLYRYPMNHLFELFLSTPSARRATRPRYALCSYYRISIHALREEGDRPTIR